MAQEKQQQQPAAKGSGVAGAGGRRVAVIGGGVAGLSAAWHLAVNTSCEVELFESGSRLGGHAYTTTVNVAGSGSGGSNEEEQVGIDVDVGFMVFNHGNYPNMVEWFRTMGVEEEDSDMSLSVSLDKGKTEWNSDGLNGLFATRSLLYKPHMWRCLRDMVRFHSHAPEILALHDDDPRKHVTTSQYLNDHNYSDDFSRLYLLPMMAALWSASMDDVANFPAAQLIGFMCNHKMLQLLQRPQWKTPAGRSQMYTSMVQSALTESGSKVHLNSPVHAVEKNKNGKYDIVVLDDNGQKKKLSEGGAFDDVVFACHPPTSKSILENAAYDGESVLKLLGEIKYADNVVYVHSDDALMPVRQRAWASWNCLGRSQHIGSASPSDRKMRRLESFEGGASGFGNTSADKRKIKKHVSFSENTLEGPEGRMKAVYVTYWLNRLQNLSTDTNVFVSLNPHTPPAPHLTHERLVMAHPQFTPATLRARSRLLSSEHYQGRGGLWFCGAWAGYGFHEDGCRSGFDVATKLSGVALPWVNNEDKDHAEKGRELLVLPPPDLSQVMVHPGGILGWLWNSAAQFVTYDLPVAVCKRFIYYFLGQAVTKGQLRLKYNDGTSDSFGDGTPCGCGDDQPVTLRVFDDWFFVKTALEYDLGLARSYMAGHFVVEPLEESKYHPVLRPPDSHDETSVALGDPIGLTRLFLLLIGNRDNPGVKHVPRKAGIGHFYSNAMTNASGLVVAKIGSLINYLRYKFTMDNSEKGGSLKNIHAHYDLSNDVFTSFLDKETLMYSCAIYDAIKAPSHYGGGLVFRGSLEEAQHRKLDTLLKRAQVKPGMKLLDIGFGWGGLCIAAATKYGCEVTGITLSVEQKALAEERVKAAGVEHLITFEVVDYRTFARRPESSGKFDRVLSCEMIEAVGHKHLGAFFWAVEQVLKSDGVLVMEAITTPEERYENYRRSTDFINTIIFPGSCCPSLHALVDAAYRQSTLTLEHIDNIGLHYAQTLAEWRRRFNTNTSSVQSLGFDDVFLRAWNYYLTYCEAAFFSQTEHCLILVFARQGCRALAPLAETRSVTQALPITDGEIRNWVDG